MSKVKAVIDFSSYPGAELLPVAQTIHKGMTTAAAIFATPPMTMAALQTLIDAFDTKLTAKSSKATADTIAFNIARHDLEDALGEVGSYVNTVAKGDKTKVDSSGFPYYDTARVANETPPAAPQNVVLRQGDLSGSFVARFRPERERSINELQTNSADPNDQSAWKHAGMFSGGKAVVGGINPGTTVWVRVRTAGLKGVMGAWSDPARMMVT
jgi:hypothetical protein